MVDSIHLVYRAISCVRYGVLRSMFSDIQGGRPIPLPQTSERGNKSRPHANRGANTPHLFPWKQDFENGAGVLQDPRPIFQILYPPPLYNRYKEGCDILFLIRLSHRTALISGALYMSYRCE